MLNVVYLGVCLLIAVALGDLCDLKRLESVSATLKYDATSLNQYQQIIAQLNRCTTEDDVQESQKDVLLDRLYYRAGITQLSLNQELNAIESFEHVTDSFNQLARTRLRKLYVEFGMWDKIDDDDEGRQRFLDLDRSVHSKWETGHDYSAIEEELQQLLEISPSCLETRSLLLETLFHRLSEGFDVSVGHEIMRNYERLLETHGARFTLKKRLHIYHSLAVIQAFVLNVEPTHLRKCLALDMDYEPCRRLTLLNNKLNKINPSRTSILDPDVYAFEKGPDVDWSALVHFYLEDKRPCMKVERDYRYHNNYELIMKESRNAIDRLLPPGTSTKKQVTTDFQKFIHMVLCYASSDRTTSQSSTQRFCKLALEEIAPKDVAKQFLRSDFEDLDLERILTDTWQSYPHLAIYMVQLIFDSRKTVSHTVQDKIAQFFQHHQLAKSSNKLIQNQQHKLNIIVRKRKQQQQRRQQQQQQQQQQWFHNQQQQQHAASPNGPRTDRDYYKILGIPKTANSKEIRKAYLEFTKKYHPDKQGQLSEEEENKIHEKMSMINEAYETLNDDQKRQEYDQARAASNGSGSRNMFRQNGPRGGGSSNFGHNFGMNFKPNFKFNF